MSQDKKKNEKRKDLLPQIYDLAELFIISICIVLLIFSFGVRLCRVSGDSMLNTLHDGELLLVSGGNRNIEKGDIIVFHQTNEFNSKLNEPIVKRVIALENEYVFINYDTGTVYVSSDDKFDEADIVNEGYDYIDNEDGTIDSPYYAKDRVYKVPKDSVFVLGDNRNNSLDSRSNEIGFVDERRILGKVQIRLTPFSEFGKVE